MSTSVEKVESRWGKGTKLQAKVSDETSLSFHLRYFIPGIQVGITIFYLVILYFRPPDGTFGKNSQWSK